MTLPKPVQALLIGGPADGRWVTTDRSYYLVSAMPHLAIAEFIRADRTNSLTNNLDDPLIPETHGYVIDRVSLFEYRLWVGLHEKSMREGTPRTTLLLRAILQRDVATALGVPRD